jgi:UDP-GlcNAc:undecaprenyl-phosphate/decaprenyl-phosphate GlcNAc-1-phosphate transferase
LLNLINRFRRQPFDSEVSFGKVRFPSNANLCVAPRMATSALFNHFSFAAALFALSAGLTWLMLRVGVLAFPNARSSHAAPVANAGGVAIVATFLAGWVILYVLVDDARIGAPHTIGFLGACVGIAAVGLFDDLGHLKTFRVKLLIQILGAVAFASFDIAFRRVTLPLVGTIELGWLGYLVTVVWLVGLTNIVNFMDGLDGLATGTAALAAFFFAAVAFLEGSYFIYFVSLVLLASTLGFFVFNYPPARIFMGDVGSQFLGFALAAIAVIAADLATSPIPWLVMPLLLFHFIFDTVFTFLRRLRDGRALTQAHRGHLYQALNRLGASHARVSWVHYMMGAAQGVAALALLLLPEDVGILMFVPFVIFEAFYAAWTMRRVRRAGIVLG